MAYRRTLTSGIYSTPFASFAGWQWLLDGKYRLHGFSVVLGTLFIWLFRKVAVKATSGVPVNCSVLLR